MTLVVVITGPPASGKTTLGERLAADLHLPYIHKDGIKERLFETLGWSDREWSRRLGRASVDLIFYFLERQLAAGASCIVESNFVAESANEEFRALHERYRFSAIQIWCVAERGVLAQRYLARDRSSIRHPGHVDPLAWQDFVGALEDERHGPLAVDGPSLQVDTTDPSSLDYGHILRFVETHSKQPPRSKRG